mmetsp:Transcript_13258/g.12006  ORF Transcript_13258/g.12006 Transcript_13258/m.12006 type:complete len:257 (-) Transcript_13258:160-930(-)
MTNREDEWQNNFFSGWCNNPINCLLGCFLPQCSFAIAKSKFDGSDCCFNCICFSNSPLLVRNYIRQGYGIHGRVGCGDFCLSACCPNCAATQLLNEVDTRGPKIVSISNERDGPFLAPEKEYSCSGDIIDCCCVIANLNLEYAGLYSTLMSVPMWVAYGSNICQVKHITRKLYGIGGNDCYDDCITPTLCFMICNCCYHYKMVSKVRAEVHHRGNPPIFQRIQAVNTGPSAVQPQYIPVASASNAYVYQDIRKVYP